MKSNILLFLMISALTLSVQAKPETGSPAPDSTKKMPRAIADKTPHFQLLPDRWRDVQPPPYQLNVQGNIWDPYNRNILKGDYPIIGQDIFFIFTGKTNTIIETAAVPTPSGISTTNPNSSGFFGKSGRSMVRENISLSFEFYKGNTAYKPRDIEIKVTTALNLNYANVIENNNLNTDPGQGPLRYDSFLAFQELLVEKHLFDLSDNYDFVSVKAGIQPFNSDFRGLIFHDTNLGVRLLGSLASNRYQYNFAYFRMLEKDTNSELNMITRNRNQDVFLLNLYRQDFLTLGYTGQLSFHYNHDKPSTYVDDNGVPVRGRTRVGVNSQPHDIKSYYLGWAGDGHWGRFNVSHAFYQVFGRDSYNPIADGPISINAQLATFELSVDQNWMRFRTSALYASGDRNIFDNKGQGFDSIVDNSFFAGGSVSYWNTQNIGIFGATLTGKASMLPNLRTSKLEGQSNFVNQGLFLLNAGWEGDFTPKARMILNASYVRFANVSSISSLVNQQIRNAVGIDYGIGLQYRPFLNNNAKFILSVSALTPLAGFTDLFETRMTQAAFFSDFIFTF